MSPFPSPTEDEPLDLTKRQIWAATTATPSIMPNQCVTYMVHGPGFFAPNATFSFNFTDNAILQECGPNATSPLNSTIGDNDEFSWPDPYFASTSPVLFVLGVCVTVAWILLLMLLMTPRTYLTGIGSSRRRPDAGISVVGVGSRPWFQKVATLFVAIALLIATYNTFSAAEMQYNDHFQDSTELTSDVLGSTEIRAIRFVSTLFEWLAQAQTALRLFPRHRERVAIKWVALSLILLEMIFGIINGFTKFGQGDDSFGRPRRFAYAFPALQYLFELALSLMYAAVIAYYAMTKRRFAFYHPEMWNITLVSLLSITAVLVPVIFFILDIAVPNIAAWGDYVRWVGAAAASVVVWEWVERIEALEREERKDGILGREIFEGDDDLGGDGMGGKASRRKRKGTNGPEALSPTIKSTNTDSSTGSSLKKSSIHESPRYRRIPKDVLRKVAAIRTLAKAKATQAGAKSKDVELQHVTGAVRRRRQRERATGGQQPPPFDPAVAAQTSASPVSRSDCTSASTVYRVVHNALSPTSTPGISETLGQNMNIVSPVQEEPADESETQNVQRRSFVDSILPFRRRSSSQSQNIPPEIVAQQLQAQENDDATNRPKGKGASGFGIFSRFRRTASSEQELPELVIPWRGENASSPQPDLEAGQSAAGPRPESMHEEWYSGVHSQQIDATNSRHDHGAGESYMAANGRMISRSGAVTFSEDPEYANRGSTRPSNSPPHDALPP